MAKAKNVEKPGPLVVKSRLPLVNPETLFSRGVWEDVLDFIFHYLRVVRNMSNEELKEGKHLTVTFRDLYFYKVYSKDFNYTLAGSEFEALGHEVEQGIWEPNDRDNEPRITVGSLELSLYKYHEATCLSLGGRTATNSVQWEMKNSLPDKVVVWNMTVNEFLETVGVIESVLTGKGSPFMCRAYFEVKLEFAKISVKAFYGDHTLWRDSSSRNDKPKWKLANRYYAPKFEIQVL